MKEDSNINWSAISVMATFVIIIISWSISVEVRLSAHQASTIKNLNTTIESLNQRVKNIEDLMTPMLVDWKVKEELRKLGIRRSSLTPPSATPAPLPPLPPVPPSTEPPKEIKESAQKWAESQIQQRSIDVQQKPIGN